MIVFSPLRTRRLEVRLKELQIGEEIELCHLPETAHEKALTEFLLRAVASADTPAARHVADPRAWTVGERLFALAHYCVHVRDDKPDYAVTNTSKLSDYLDTTKDFPATLAAFNVLDDKWVLHPLTGAAAEAIETLQVGTDPERGREHWIFGGMAAQLLRENETYPNPITQNPEYLDWLTGRMATLRALPSSSFDMLYAGCRHAMEKSTNYFRFWFDDQGVIVLPMQTDLKEAGAIVSPARFLVFSAIGDLALSLTGKA
jgi:hypothetical protein